MVIFGGKIQIFFNFKINIAQVKNFGFFSVLQTMWFCVTRKNVWHLSGSVGKCHFRLSFDRKTPLESFLLSLVLVTILCTSCLYLHSVLKPPKKSHFETKQAERATSLFLTREISNFEISWICSINETF